MIDPKTHVHISPQWPRACPWKISPQNMASQLDTTATNGGSVLKSSGMSFRHHFKNLTSYRLYPQIIKSKSWIWENYNISLT